MNWRITGNEIIKTGTRCTALNVRYWGIIIKGTNKIAGITRNYSQIFFMIYLILSILFV